MTLRWGIVASGLIASDFVCALKVLPKDEHQVVAVAARSSCSAKKFAKAHNIPKYYEGYINIAKDEDVLIVYVATLNPQHYEVVKMMLEHGKHVLCEKPLAMNAKQAREMIELAKSRKLFLMEAVMPRFFPVYKEIKKLLEAGEIGEVRYVLATFGVVKKDVDRITRKELGGSIIMDLGVYCLQFQQFVYNGIIPEKVTIAGHLNENGVDDVALAIFSYPDGKTAVVSANGTADLISEGVIVGTKGTITIPEVRHPTSYTLNGEVKEIPLIENNEEFNFPNSAGLAYEAIEVRELILFYKKLESCKMPHKHTLQLATWLEEIRREIGVVYPEDSK